MTTFNWNCRTVDVYPTDETYADVVYNVHWIVTGTSDQLDPQDNPYTATNIGTQTLNTSDNIDAQIENLITPTSLTLTIGEPIPPA